MSLLSSDGVAAANIYTHRAEGLPFHRG